MSEAQRLSARRSAVKSSSLSSTTTIERSRLLAPLPFGLARMQAMLLQFAPGPLKLTPDQVEMLRTDNVVSKAATDAGLTLQGLGIAPTSLEQAAPAWLWRFRRTGQFRPKVS